MKEYKLLSGALMPALGLGTWKSDPGVVGAAVKEAIKLGYRHIDCAAIYGNESEIGKSLKECFDEGIVKRKDLFITSKLWVDNYAPEDVKPALQQTLQDLQLEYLDLYLMHWPVAKFKDGTFASLEERPLSKTFQAMQKCVDDGLVRDIGVSNFSTKKLASLVKETGLSPTVNQVERHPYLQQKGMQDFCAQHNIHLTAYSPLGSSGRPAGFKKDDDPTLLQDKTIREVADKIGATPAQVLLCWAIQGGTSAAAKSVSPKRLAENLAAADLTLDEEDMKTIAYLDRHLRYIDGALWVKEGSPYTLENLWDE